MTRHRHRYNSGPLPSCFRPPTPSTTDEDPAAMKPPPSPPLSSIIPSTATPNLTTSIYHTRIGIFALTWSRTLLGRSLRLHLFPNNTTHPHRSISLPTPRAIQIPSSSSSSPTTSSSSSSFHLTLKPFLFWNKQGSKKLTSPQHTTPATVYWDFTRAKFGSSPEPESHFYIAVISPNDGSIALLLGDSDQKAQTKTKSKSSQIPLPSARSVSQSCSGQSLVVRREHVQGAAKLYRTKVQFGGKTRQITIECDETSQDPRLLITVDSKLAVQIKHLKWKFRGSERIEIDGYPIQISWDVHNWLFSDSAESVGGVVSSGDSENGCFGLFTFRFEKRAAGELNRVAATTAVEEEDEHEHDERVYWSEELSGMEENRRMMMSRKKGSSLSMSGLLIGRRKHKQKQTRSSSSSSVSSASSSACGSVLEWESIEESELKGGDGPTAFSLLVYAWKT